MSAADKNKIERPSGGTQQSVPRLSVCADEQKVDRSKLCQSEVSRSSHPATSPAVCSDPPMTSVVGALVWVQLRSAVGVNASEWWRRNIIISKRGKGLRLAMTVWGRGRKGCELEHIGCL